MQINGLVKTTLLDYPKHLAATVFIGSCNMRCPFCHNSSLVTKVYTQPVIPEKELFNYLQKRKGILEGVCITGGEPTIHPELTSFISNIKSMGYKVKLDTNGTNPDMLKELVKLSLIDYIAMDIKNSKEHYGLSAGIPGFDTEPVEESIAFLLEEPVDYEFRTTVVKELHTPQDMISIGNWIKGAKAYYLQAFKDSGDVLEPGLSAPDKETILNYKELLAPYVKYVGIRGVD
jgi:pyruvate formate lyase activating enzyme